jgi:hypothetical protein
MSVDSAVSSMWRRMLACMAMLLLWIPAIAAEPPRVLALLVGVSKYPSLPRNLQLQDAPGNDVQLFARYLRHRGVADAGITILSDSQPAAAAPTRREILAGLSRLAAQARPGDIVVVMFSGHGSQQPSRQDARIEPEGMDQIFLPQDVASWDGSAGQVRNAITDDEIGSALAQLRARGALVWAIFDTCRAGTLTRGEADPDGTRQVAPEQLGVPAAALRAARGRTSSASPGSRRAARFASQATAGGYVAFFASQREQVTGQVEVGMGLVRGSYGRFTWTLVQALEARPDANYRQVMEMVLMKYQGMGVFNTTPGYEGTALDDGVLGDAGSGRVVQWPVYADKGLLRLDAGLLQGITAGSVLSLFASPAAAADESLGYARVQQADPADATLLPVEYNRRPAPRWHPGTTNSGGAPLFHARPVDLAVDLTLRVAEPRRERGCERPDTLLNEAVATLRQRAQLLPRIQWVAADADADVRLCQQAGKLIFIESMDAQGKGYEGLKPATGSAPVTRGAPPTALADAIATSLARIGRVQNLYRIASRHASANRLVEASVQLCPGAGANTAPCARGSAVATTARPVIHSGDRLDISLRNSGWDPVYVTVLYIDASFRIQALYPDPAIPQEHARIPARSNSITIPVGVNADPAGFERVLVIAVAAAPGSDEVNLANLTQEGNAPLELRGAEDAGIAGLITQAVRGIVTRGEQHAAFDRSVEFTGFGWMVEQAQAPKGSRHGE